MKKITIYKALLTAAIIVLISCTPDPTINGLWESTGESGTLEFKASGEFITKDNMSGIITGTYQLTGDTITLDLLASNIFHDSVEPESEVIVITAKIIKLSDEELWLYNPSEDEEEKYQRVQTQ